MSIKHSTDRISSDIVVVGAGGAGLAAAVSAAEAGVKNMIVLEKAPRPGGNSASTGCVFAVNSPLQKRLGIEVSADKVFEEKMAHCNWTVNARLVRNVINMSGDMMQWLEEKGVVFTHIMLMIRHAGNAPRVTHDITTPGHPGVTGRTIINTLHNECAKHGIRVICNARANNILTDTDRKVNGVTATTPEKELLLTTKSVILTTGGLGGSKEMLNKYFPRHGDLFSNSQPTTTGDGILMAEQVVAIVDDQMSMLRGPAPLSPKLGILFGRDEVLVVNKEGERFFDEALSLKYNPDDGSNIIDRQRDKMCYAVLDDKIKQNIMQNKEGLSEMEKAGGGTNTLDEDIKKAVAEGKAMQSDSLIDIANFIGTNPEVLKNTVEIYNAFCDNHYDGIF